MTFLNMEPATFLVRKKGLDMPAFFVLCDRRIQIAHIRDQIDRLLILLLPERQNTDRAVLLSSHPCRAHREEFPSRRSQIANVEPHSAGADQNSGGSSANILPATSAQI